MGYGFRHLGAGDLPLARALLAVLGEAFGEPETYGGRPPDDAYLARLLGRPQVLVLAALAGAGATVVGGLITYELE